MQSPLSLPVTLAFETALEAIRQQVDDYLIKPADIQSMVERIHLKLTNPKKAASIPRLEPRSVTEILDQNKPEIVQRWLAAAKQDPQIASARLSDHELTEHLPSVIEQATSAVDGRELSKDGLDAAALYGRARFKQGCTIPALVRESRILQQVLSRFIQESLLGVEISSLVPGVMQIGESIQAYFEAALREYVHARYSATETVQNKGKSLLLLSGDRELGLLRAHVLKHAGFSITRADSRKEALTLLREKFDALVISYSLNSESVLEMATLFRQQNPNAPIITIAKGEWQHLKVDTDFTLNGDEGPEAMIETVESAFNRKQLRLIK